jgi:Ca2+-binding RTX toxin-like protein
VLGGNGNDLVRGGTGDDHVSGSNDNDVVIGDAGNDHVFGNEGSDIVAGSDGNDLCNGGEGDDNVNGGAGNDNVDGVSGNDLLFGGIGNDIVNGGDGVDTIELGPGDDIASGGPGSDTFRFRAADGLRDAIVDFTRNETDVDRIDLSLAYAGELTFRGSSGFTAEGQVRVVTGGSAGDPAGFYRLVQVNLDANTATAELMFKVYTTGGTLLSLTAEDFVL